MKLPNPNQGEWLDRWLLGFSILGMALFLYILNDNSAFFQSRHLNQGAKIGDVDKLIRDVRRRATDDFVWLPLSDLEDIYIGDSIFTGSKSSVSIRLSTGVNLWIDPDSLVVLDQTENLTKLDLKFGNLRGNFGANSTSLLKLNVNDQDMDLEGKSVEFSLEKKKSKNTNLKVTEGQAKLTEVKSKKQIFIEKKHQVNFSREIASIGNLAALEEDPIFIRMEQWGENKNLWFSEKQKLKFQWQTEGPVDHFKLIVSMKEDLSHPLINETIKMNGYEWTPPFSEGKIFWKVEVYKKETSKVTLQSEVIQWNIGLLTAPEWKISSNPLYLSPARWTSKANEKNVNDAKSKKEEAPVLDWNSSNKASQFRLQIGKDPQFKENSSGLEIQQNKWVIPKLEIGKYFARVRSENVGRPPSIWSHTLIIEVSDLDPDGLLEPEILTKEMESQIGANSPELKWVNQEKTSEFLVENSLDFNFGKIIQSQKVKGTTLVVTPKILMGDSYFRIYPLSPQGRKGPVSKPIVWHLRPHAPLWKHQDNKLSIGIPRDENDQLLAFPDTPIQWKIWTSRDQISDVKNKSKILPKKILKQNDKKIISLQKKINTTIDYDKLFANPNRYILESSLDIDFMKVEKKELATASFLLKNLIPGLYFYRVRSVYKISSNDINLTSTQSATNSDENRSFEIVSLPSEILKLEVFEVQKDGLLSPILSSKTPDAVLEGDKQAVTQIKWEKRGPAVKFKLQVAEDMKFNSVIMEKVLDQNQSDLIVKKSGKYLVRVAGISEKNRVGPWSGISSWNVRLGSLQILPLDTLMVTLPNATSVIPPGHFSVRWLAPVEIKKFQIELSDNINFNNFKLKEIVKDNSYSLKVNEPGKYYLRVKGLSEEGSDLTKYSKTEVVKYFIKKPMQSPTLILPKDRVSYILSKMENPEVWLEWQGDKLSNQYLIEFSTDRNFNKILYSLKPKDNRILLDHEVIRGKVFWRVKGLNVDQGLESSWSPAWSLSVVDIESDD